MILLVSDTSILIDLERGNLLEIAFACGLTLVVPDLLYEKELANYNGPYLRALGLTVVALDPDEVGVAQATRAACLGLSLPDCFALSCATRADHALITGDGRLRAEAVARGVRVYGLLWLLDQMHSSHGVSSAQLHAGLTQISGHPRCRLPRPEVKARLDLWC